jgi:hypothetical protein
MKSRRTRGTLGHGRRYEPGCKIMGSQKSNSFASAPATTPRANCIVPIFSPGRTGVRFRPELIRRAEEKERRAQ